MTKATRILRNIGIGLGIFIIVVAIAAIAIVRTDWFRNYVRQKIITSTEQSTGGTVEVGAFSFEWSHLRAVVNNFVIHGNEPAGAAPFLRVARVEVHLRLFTSIKHILDIAYLGADEPQANIISFADGRTNIPTPAQKSDTNQTTLENVVDAAVGHFELTRGYLVVNDRKQPLEMTGNNLKVQLWYSTLLQGYKGQLSLQPVYVVSGKNTPVTLTVTLPVTLQSDHVDFDNAKIASPASEVVLTGSIENMRDPKASLRVNGHVDLAELGRLAKPGGQVAGVITLNGNARLYENRVDLTGIQLGGFGGEFTGDASLEDFRHFKLAGNLNHLDVQAAARDFGQKNFAYEGFVSGPIHAEGDLKAPGTSGMSAEARLAIAPGRRGIPVSGRLNLNYNGATENVSVENSYLRLPNTTLNLSGSIGNRLNVSLTTTNLNDLLAALGIAGKPPITLVGGRASFTGVVAGSLAAPHISGHLAVSQFSVEGRRFDQLVADLAASRSGVNVANASLTRSPLSAQFSATAGLRDWKPTPNQPLTVDAAVRNADLADVMALAGEPGNYSGVLNADTHINGTIGNPRGAANLRVANGTIRGETFDSINANVNMADRVVNVKAGITAGTANLTLAADFQHPRDSFTEGRLHARIQSNQVNLAQIHAFQNEHPNTSGMLNLDADVTGDVSPTKEFRLVNITADASARTLRFEGENYGDANASVRTNGQTVHYTLASGFAGSTINAKGSTQLVRGYPTTADATVSNLRVEKVLAVVKRRDIPVTGSLSGKLHFAGTTEKPEGTADVDLANAVVHDEPIDHLRARLTYLARSIDVPQLEIQAGPSRLDLTAHYEHPAGNLREGEVRFQVNRGRIDLARVRNVQDTRPGLGGILQLTANGTAAIRETSPRILVRDVSANVSATGIQAQGKNLGDLKLTAKTAGGRVNFDLDSNLANAAIHGRGNATLGGDYPVTAQLTFSNVTWSGLQPLLKAGSAGPASFEALAAGEANVSGPITKPDDLRGSFQVTTLRLSALPRGVESKTQVVIQNQGPIVAALDRGALRIDSFHLTGHDTDIQARGTVGFTGQGMNLAVNANTDLALLQDFSREVHSSGAIVLATTVHGTAQQPLVNGTLTLREASMIYMEMPVGISHANGVVEFNGNSASIQNLTAQSGGGQVALRGYAVYAQALRFGLRANATKVRVRPVTGASVVTDASLTLTGTTQASMLSGTVTVDEVTYSPAGDLGSMLTAAAPAVQAPPKPNSLLDNLKLAVNVRTSSGTTVQAAEAKNLQVYADLRVRGTASLPSVLGRATVSEGQLAFFGYTYTINRGTIAFYNPARIDPILDLSLETKAKGVDVVLNVTGPVDNMKLSYTSDPPLQFQEIVSLLAAGKTPTSDPTLLANEPSQPPQSFEQMGESALLSQAIANPVSSRLERVFGVTQLKIDPSFVSGQELPQARLTLQQQITSNLTFTYVQAMDAPNTQIVRVEMALNPQWSAVAMRDQYGIFSIHLFYKKQFR